MPTIKSEQAILSVKQLNVLAKDILESSFPSVLVEGEISNLAQPSSGHAYFTLKDSSSQIRAALFAGQKRRLNFALENGQKVVVKGSLSIFGARGDYQLIAKHLQPAGEGALLREFELLKEKLEKRGWFDPQQKQTLPKFCRHLAVITSPSGAAIRDILHVLERRFPLMEVTIFPSLVQGKQASKELCMALRKVNQLKLAGKASNNFDLILMSRGGGSLEDLWPFNEETLAEAIHESQLPVISGVGHETDYTICDLVADYRAPTPSAAAETLSQDQEAICSQLDNSLEHLKNAMSLKLQQAHQKLNSYDRRNISPQKQLQEQAQRLYFLNQRLNQNMRITLQNVQHKLEQKQNELRHTNPIFTIRSLQEKHRFLQKSLTSSLKQQINHKLIKPQLAIGNLAKRLNSVSPLNTLDRGYSISRLGSAPITKGAAFDTKFSIAKPASGQSKNQTLINETTSIKIGQVLYSELSHVNIESQVTKVLPKK